MKKWSYTLTEAQVDSSAASWGSKTPGMAKTTQLISIISSPRESPRHLFKRGGKNIPMDRRRYRIKGAILAIWTTTSNSEKGTGGEIDDGCGAVVARIVEKWTYNRPRSQIRFRCWAAKTESLLWVRRDMMKKIVRARPRREVKVTLVSEVYQ